MYPSLPPPPPFPLPYLVPPLPLSVTHHLSFTAFPPPPPPLTLSLQEDGWTALMAAAKKGETEAIKLLLAAPDIDVNHANVSHYLPTPSHLVVGGRYKAPYPSL